MGIFKENDIRGLYPEEWDRTTAVKIGFALAEIFEGRKIVIGLDGRSTSKEISSALTGNLTQRGFQVFNIGIVDTPAVYFTVGSMKFDGGIMITASHNPVEYNGIKLTSRNTVPIVYSNGINRVEELVRVFEGESSVSAYEKEDKASVHPLDIVNSLF